MDAGFLLKSQCYFGGGTQLALAHGEYRESRDIDFLVSSPDGIRAITETVGEKSLGKIFKEPISLARDVVRDRDAVRTYIAEDPASDPIKLEIIYEARIRTLGGALDPGLRVPVLDPSDAVAEKLLANVDRGSDRTFHSRDVIDLAFAALDLDNETFRAGVELAQTAYGNAVLRDLSEALKKLELDARYRAQCVERLLIDDPKRLRQGIARLRALRRIAAETRRLKVSRRARRA